METENVILSYRTYFTIDRKGEWHFMEKGPLGAITAATLPITIWKLGVVTQYNAEYTALGSATTGGQISVVLYVRPHKARNPYDLYRFVIAPPDSLIFRGLTHALTWATDVLHQFER